jgi:alpha-L-rhamnosidase
MKTILSLACILVVTVTAHAQNLPAPSGLAVNFLRSPDAAVITDATPEFSWMFPQSGVQQSAYRILVATSPNLLKENRADCWDSGVIRKPTSVNVSYAGSPLKDNSTYWWQAKVWSRSKLESQYSHAQQFNTGNFDRSGLDYPGQSKWIELATGQWVSEDKQCATFSRINPVLTTTPDNKSLFVDFGKSAIGILEFTATSEQDDVPITVHLGERSTEAQAVHKQPGRSNIGYDRVEMHLKKGTHHYVVKITEREIKGYLHTQKLAPHYPEVMPFRYAEILGDFQSFRLSNLTQGALFYYFDEEASDFQCSNDNLKVVWDLCRYTQKSTPFLGVYADGNRERMPYEADAYIQQMSHFSVDREYSISRYTINFLLDHASWPTEWQMHVIMMAWEYYMQSGDDHLLKTRYEDLKRKSLIALTDDNGLISTRTGKKTEAFLRTLNFPGRVTQFRDIVDWPQGPPKGRKAAGNQSPWAGGETDGYVYNDYNAVVNAFHYRSLVLMGRIARVVGNMEDHAFFVKRSHEHKAAYVSIFLDRDKGVFKDGDSTDHASLHANMFPMAFGMVPEADIKTVAEFIKSRGMACSVYGSQYLLEALYHAGEADHAMALMTSDDRRSWLNMIRVGSSMTTEAWDEYFKPNLTWNHAWGSAPANITARKLMGIEPTEATFSHFRISPQPGTLEQASIKVPCIRGAITCELVNKADQWQMTVSVPGNSEAEIWLPAQFTRVHINGLDVTPIRKTRFAGGTRKVYPLESGLYTILAQQ